MVNLRYFADNEITTARRMECGSGEVTRIADEAVRVRARHRCRFERCTSKNTVAAHLVARHPNQKDCDIAETLFSVMDTKCIMTKNIQTSLGVANGSRGVTVGIELRVDDVDWSPDINASLSVIS